MLQRALTSMILMATALLGACASAGPADLRIEPGQYVEAFEAAKDVLRDLDFSLERVDAAGGVITTSTRASAGLATPWDRQQSTAGQEIEEFLNRDARRARVTFEAEAAAGTRPWQDLRTVDRPMTMRARVELVRRQRPGWRLATAAVRSSSRFSDPVVDGEAGPGEFETALSDDPALAGRIAAAVAERLAQRERASR